MTALVARSRPTASSDDRLTIPQDRSFLPWTSDNVVRLLVLDLGALTLIIASWYLISGSTSLREQMAWLKLALIGLALSGVANGLWLMSGRRAIGLARVQVLGRLQSAVGAERVDQEQMIDSQAVPRDDTVFVGARMSRFHRRGCPLAHGRELTGASRAELVDRGYQPCELCEP
jgi:hypothetical protein